MEDAFTTMPDGSKITGWKHPDVHWYIVGRQDTVTVCRELAEQFLEDFEARKELLKFEMILVFFRDPHVLVSVSNALNLHIAEKVAKETFRSFAELS